MATDGVSYPPPAMAPRPTDRLGPAAVLSALRGEGSGTAPGPGGSYVPGATPGSPGFTAVPQADTADLAADVVVDLARWLLDTIGTGPGGHLWPAGAAAASLDPIAVQAGAAGVGLFLVRLLERAGGLPDRAQRRLAVR